MESLASINFTNEDLETLQKALSLYVEKNEYVSSILPAMGFDVRPGFFGQQSTKWKSADQHDKLILLQAKCVRLKQFLNSPVAKPEEPAAKQAPEVGFDFDPATQTLSGTIVVERGHGIEKLLNYLKEMSPKPQQNGHGPTHKNSSFQGENKETRP
jgi:hypothetical protein